MSLEFPAKRKWISKIQQMTLSRSTACPAVLLRYRLLAGRASSVGCHNNTAKIGLRCYWSFSFEKMNRATRMKRAGHNGSNRIGEAKGALRPMSKNSKCLNLRCEKVCRYCKYYKVRKYIVNPLGGEKVVVYLKQAFFSPIFAKLKAN